METKQKFHLLVYPNKQRVKDGLCALYVRVYIDGKRSEFATSHYISEKNWDSIKMRALPVDKNATLLNAYFENVKSNFNKLFIAAAANGELISAQELRNRFLGKEVEDKPTHKTILEAFDYHNIKIEEQVKIGKVVPKTLTRYKITKNKVKAFMKHQYKKADMPLPELRLRFVTEFEHYLLTIDKLQSNTAHKYIKNLKKIMNMSVGLDWIPSNPFNNFRCSYTSPERQVLTQEELNLIMNKDIHIERLAEVRDVFIFCCYTGFAYSDAYKFERDALTIGIDGEYWLSTNRQKTGTRESVPLLPIALEIIQKYQDHEYCKEYNKLLPVNSNQRYNAYLKELADICGIKKKVTTHIARHTFATTVTLANGVPIETVSSMLGHNSIRTTQIYAKVVEKKVSEDMLMLKAKLFGKAETEQEVERKIG